LPKSPTALRATGLVGRGVRVDSRDEGRRVARTTAWSAIARIDAATDVDAAISPGTGDSEHADGRFTTPEEATTLVALLASPCTADVTGSNYVIDGGLIRRCEQRQGGSMVKISDKSDYSRFVRPADEDEGIWLDHVEVHLVTHPVGQVKEMHVHDPPQDHVIVIRSGRMRWTVEEQTLDAAAGDVIVTPAGTSHGYEVLGNEPARVVCIDSPKRPKPTS
jgi:quercetin dioxygenase-like cupin family protein